MKENNTTRYRQVCTMQILPFNHTENDDVYLYDINCIENLSRSISQIISNPIEFEFDIHYSTLCSAGPDIN